MNIADLFLHKEQILLSYCVQNVLSSLGARVLGRSFHLLGGLTSPNTGKVERQMYCLLRTGNEEGRRVKLKAHPDKKLLEVQIGHN